MDTWILSFKMCPRGTLCLVHLHKQHSMLTSQSFRIWEVDQDFSWFRGEYQKLTSVTCHLAPFQPPVIQNISSKKAEKSERESLSVMSNSLRPHGLYSRGIFQSRILEWVAFPFCRRSSQSRDQTQVSHIAGGFFTS